MAIIAKPKNSEVLLLIILEYVSGKLNMHMH
jgi:hypothetical protein